MLDYSDPARARALRNSVLFLGHRFPNVRKTTAEALYLKLLANEDVVRVIPPYPCGVATIEAFISTGTPSPSSASLRPQQAVYDEALDILTCTAWDGDLHTAKSARSALANLLGVNNVPAPKKAAGSRGDSETTAAPPD
ncbi:unnamed protein product, partial [Hapterophycus canaliculatus]